MKLQIPEMVAGEQGQPGFVGQRSPAEWGHRERHSHRGVRLEGGRFSGEGVPPSPCREARVLFSVALVSAASWPLASGCAMAGHSLRYFKACFLLARPRGFG